MEFKDTTISARALINAIMLLVSKHKILWAFLFANKLLANKSTRTFESAFIYRTWKKDTSRTRNYLRRFFIFTYLISDAINISNVLKLTIINTAFCFTTKEAIALTYLARFNSSISNIKRFRIQVSIYRALLYTFVINSILTDWTYRQTELLIRNSVITFRTILNTPFFHCQHRWRACNYTNFV